MLKIIFSIISAAVCSSHFSPECFLPKRACYVGYYSPKRWRNLKEDAIPTENLFWKLSSGTSNSQDTKQPTPAPVTYIIMLMEPTKIEFVDDENESEQKSAVEPKIVSIL